MGAWYTVRFFSWFFYGVIGMGLKELECNILGEEHRYEPISWMKTNTSEHVVTLMCMRCFHRLGMHEIEKLKTESRSQVE